MRAPWEDDRPDGPWNDDAQDALRLGLFLGEGLEHPEPLKGCIRRGLCCRTNPGSFSPGEIEAAAALLRLDVDTFVKRFVIIHPIEDVMVFAPVKVARDGQPVAPPGTLVDETYLRFPSPCVFFDGRGCGIYDARPTECARYVCTNGPGQNLSKAEIAAQWRA